MTYNEQKSLFGKAVLEGLSEKYEKELADSELSVELSEAYTSSMQNIIRKHGIVEGRKRKGKLVALLVAAVLLLAGCTMYVYRDEIRKFNLTFSSVGVRVTFQDGQKSEVRTIEEVYTLSYIPEGYVLDSESIGELSVRYIWRNKDRDLIIFTQSLIGIGVTGFDIEHGEIIPVEGHEDTVFHIVTSGKHNYLWNDGKYELLLQISTDHDIEEIRKIINGILTK